MFDTWLSVKLWTFIYILEKLEFLIWKNNLFLTTLRYKHVQISMNSAESTKFISQKWPPFWKVFRYCYQHLWPHLMDVRNTYFWRINYRPVYVQSYNMLLKIPICYEIFKNTICSRFIEIMFAYEVIIPHLMNETYLI